MQGPLSSRHRTCPTNLPLAHIHSNMGKKEDQTLDQHVSGQANGNGLSKPAHALTFSQVTEDIKANAENGLSSSEAKERSGKYGSNELGDAGGVEPGKILIRQIANAMTLVRFE